MTDREEPNRDRPRREGGKSGAGRPRRDGQGPDGQRSGRDGSRRADGDPARNGRRGQGDRPRTDGGSRHGGERPRRSDGDRRYGEDRPRYGDGARRGQRDGERRYGEGPRGDREQRQRDGKRSYGDRPSRAAGDRSGGDRARRDGDRSYDRRTPRDGDRSYERRGPRDGDRAPAYGRGGTRGGGRSDRGGREREFTEAERLQHELRPVRADHEDPVIPDEVTAKDLPSGARNELKTLQPETQDRVARHLAMVVDLIEEDPELAHQHAISASRRAGRIPVVREMLAATAYRTGDYALALRELRTHRRLSGSQGNIALMVEAERALARPQKAIETGLEADATALNAEQRAQLAIAMSGARLDLGQTQQALFELEIPELNPNRAYSYSPELFAAYAAVLEDLGRDAEARTWRKRAEQAEAALNELIGGHDELEVFEVYEHEPEQVAESETGADAEAGPDAGSSPEADPEPARESEPGAESSPGEALSRPEPEEAADDGAVR